MLLLDAHSHLHPRFRLAAFLDGARASFARLASARGLSAWQGCLWVADTATSGVRGRLERARRRGDEFDPAGWRVTPTEEPVSWVARHRDGGRLLLILGRQLRTDEGLEVLQVGSLAQADGTPSGVREQVSGVLERGGYPVVPWGFGKWTLRRKRVLLDCLRAWDPREVVLADSALRPRGLSSQAVLSAAREQRFTVLAGTDPLPLASHENGSGRFVAALDLELSTDRPWSELRASLPDVTPALIGQRDSLVRSLWDQTRLRLSRS